MKLILNIHCNGQTCLICLLLVLLWIVYFSLEDFMGTYETQIEMVNELQFLYGNVC